jgi:predicted aspartyl protease
MRGFFDPKNGTAKVEIEVSGTIPGSQRKIIALFDTGHTGSLSLPILDLIQIGATLQSYGQVRFANGHKGIVYYFSVQVTIDGKTKTVQAGMIENPSEKEAIAGLELFAEYVSFIDFKNKKIIFKLEDEFRKSMPKP